MNVGVEVGRCTHDAENYTGQIARNLGIVAGLEEMVEAALQLLHNPAIHPLMKVKDYTLFPMFWLNTHHASPASAACSIAVDRSCWTSYESESEYSNPYCLTNGTNSSCNRSSAKAQGRDVHSAQFHTYPPESVQFLQDFGVLIPGRSDERQIAGDRSPHQVLKR